VAVALFGGFQLGLVHLKRERLARDRLTRLRNLNLHKPESAAGLFPGGADPQQQLIALGQAFAHRAQIARIFKWLTLALFAYIAAAFFAHPDWPAVVRAILIPQVQWTGAYWATLAGILGTTISPYLFFWQAEKEV
jgi:hypothetical protein